VKLDEFGDISNSFVVFIKSVNDQGLSVEFEPFLSDFFEDGVLTKMVSITDVTSLEKLVKKPEKQIFEEYNDYVVRLEKYKADLDRFPDTEKLLEPQAPDEFIISTIQLSDLKMGDQVRLSTDDNVRILDTLVATRIELLSFRKLSENSL
jgi:hypothetical protein